MAILYGIKKVILEELDSKTGLPTSTSPVKLTITTADSAELEPVYSEGEEEVLRSPSSILAVVRTDDLLYGYDFTLKDNTFTTEVAKLVAGYEVTGEDESSVISTPMMTSGNQGKAFRTTIYVANYSGDSIDSYCKITLNKCMGKFPKMTIGNEFYAPEFEIKARENTLAKLPIKTMEFVDELPTS